MDWVSFDEIKQTVSLEMALNHYRVPLRRMGTSVLRGKCPLPTHKSETSKESFTATLSKGIGGAWACQSQSCIKSRGRVGGNVLDFVAAMEQCSVRDAAIKLQTWFLVPAAGDHPELVGKEPDAEISAGKERMPKRISEKENHPEQIVRNEPLKFTLQKIDHAHPYLKERGVTEEIAQGFGVGIFSGKGSMQGRCVIPIHNRDGELLAYAGRSIDGSEPRYKFPAGFHKSRELFNLHRLREQLSVILVEGFFGCIRVTQAGYPCVALMGSTMSRTQEKLLAEIFAHVIVMLDGDDAGRGAAIEIADRLQRVVYNIQTIELPDRVQPDQLLVADLRRLLNGIPSAN